MLILIDRANIDLIRETLDYLPIDGVTTNPTILANEGGDPLEVLRKIHSVLPEGSQLHVQVVSHDRESMVAEGRALRAEFGKHLHVKIPVTHEGFAAINMLASEGIPVTATGVHSTLQGFMAAQAGARYVAPYVNRMDNFGINGVRVATEIHQILRTHHLHADVLAASFKNSDQVLRLVEAGIGAITAAPSVLAALVANPITDVAIAAQDADFARQVGGEETFSDLIALAHQRDQQSLKVAQPEL